MMVEKQDPCICLNCIYSAQPGGYFPIVCVQGKRIKEMWHEVYTCRHFEPCPEIEQEPEQEPWKVALTE